MFLEIAFPGRGPGEGGPPFGPLAMARGRLSASSWGSDLQLEHSSWAAIGVGAAQATAPRAGIWLYVFYAAGGLKWEGEPHATGKAMQGTLCY
jgi:hypothetical protein